MKTLFHLSLAAILMGCAGCAEEPAGIPHSHDDAAETVLCGLCGYVKESESCCQEGAEKCANCGLHKGSILCCSPAINGVRDIILCRKCGEVAFTEKCCQDGAQPCAKCGLHEGSPGCCKIEPFDPNESHAGTRQTHAHEQPHG